MTSRQVHISLPDDLLFEIDGIVGPRGRSAFLDTARAAVKRRKLLAFLESGEMAWKDEDHPELAKGSAEWFRRQGTKLVSIEKGLKRSNFLDGNKKAAKMIGGL